MNTKLCKTLICLCALSICLLMPTVTSASEKPAQPMLSVDGSGLYEAEPDQASISVGITTHSTDAQDAQNQNAAVASNIQTALLAIGIPEKASQTRNYNFRPTLNTEKGHENEYNGYTVDNTMNIRLDDTSLVGQVIDTALSNGASRINSLQCSARNTQKLRKEALLAAIKDARDKADVIAEGLGKHIVGVQNVSESSSIQSHSYDTAMFAKSAMNAATPISAGTLESSATVHIDFILSN